MSPSSPDVNVHANVNVNVNAPAARPPVARRAVALASTALGLVALASALSLTAPAAHADHVTFSVPDEGPLPAAARSFVVGDESVAIMAGPGPLPETPLAGHTERRVGFPVYEARRGRACRHQWVRIGPDAWICGDRGQLSVQPPTATPHPRRADAMSALPFPYAFTQRDGVRAYHTFEAALAGSDAEDTYETWEANWGFAIAEVLATEGGRVVRARSGQFLRRSDLYRAQSTEFAGAPFWTLAGEAPGVPFGWVAVGDTWVYPTPSEEGRGEPLRRLSRVHVYGTRGVTRGRVFARIGENRWVRADKLRWIAPQPPPREVNVAARERWIDVDATSQTLIAYEGSDPVYATMVSTGLDRFATEPGVHRIWGRFLTLTMDNTESAHLPNHFRLADVPYVQFFDGDRGLHAVYWHDQFGVARSHGCVNLSPRDAAWLFEFTAHPLPAGWASRAMPRGQGTVVRVRGRYQG